MPLTPEVSPVSRLSTTLRGHYGLVRRVPCFPLKVARPSFAAPSAPQFLWIFISLLLGLQDGGVVVSYGASWATRVARICGGSKTEPANGRNSASHLSFRDSFVAGDDSRAERVSSRRMTAQIARDII
jgi:hypothetical protein